MQLRPGTTYQATPWFLVKHRCIKQQNCPQTNLEPEDHISYGVVINTFLIFTLIFQMPR